MSCGGVGAPVPGEAQASAAAADVLDHRRLGSGLPIGVRCNGGLPLLEVHHIKPLAEGGPDTVDNAVAICPTRYRACHHAADKASIRDTLVKSVARLVAH